MIYFRMLRWVYYNREPEIQPYVWPFGEQSGRHCFGFGRAIVNKRRLCSPRSRTIQIYQAFETFQTLQNLSNSFMFPSILFNF